MFHIPYVTPLKIMVTPCAPVDDLSFVQCGVDGCSQHLLLRVPTCSKRLPQPSWLLWLKSSTGLTPAKIAWWCTAVFLLLVSQSVLAQNLLVDGSFELLGGQPSKSAWVLPKEGASMRAGAGRPQTGQAGPGYAAVLTPNKNYGTELVQPLMPLVPGRRYLLTAWVYTNQPGTQAYIGVRMKDGFTRVFRELSGAGWERIDLVFSAGEGWAQVVLSNTADTAVYWDDVVLQENTSAVERIAAEWDRNLQQGHPIYTGLVVDARNTGLERGMSPKIYSADGRLLFAGTGASFDQLIRKGIVAYVHTLEEAAAHPRLAVSDEYPLRLPLIVDAQGVSGMPRTGVVIGAEDARRVRDAVNQYDFLGRFAIVFVVD